jgi:hypothetical protein
MDAHSLERAFAYQYLTRWHDKYKAEYKHLSQHDADFSLVLSVKNTKLDSDLLPTAEEQAAADVLGGVCAIEHSISSSEAMKLFDGVPVLKRLADSLNLAVAVLEKITGNHCITKQHEAFSEFYAPRKSFELGLCNSAKAYAKHLPDNEAKPILSYLEDDIQQAKNDIATNKVKPPTPRKRGKTQINIFLEQLCKEQDIDSLSGKSLVSAIKIFVDTKNSIEKQNCPVKKHHGWYKQVSVEWKPKAGSHKGSWGSKSFQNFVGEYKKTNAKNPVKD